LPVFDNCRNTAYAKMAQLLEELGLSPIDAGLDD
jgi:hypothetical protein